MFDAEPPVVAGALSSAYYTVGAVIGGCPDRGVRRVGGLVLVPLDGGRDGPALLVSDAEGHAAIVLHPLLDYANELIASGLLDRVLLRHSTGVGDEQVFVLTTGGCSLAFRRTFEEGYLRLSPRMTALLVPIVLAREAFPRLAGIEDIAGRSTLHFAFASRAGGEEEVVLRDDAGWDPLRGRDGAGAAPCPDLDPLDVLVAALLARYEATADG